MKTLILPPTDKNINKAAELLRNNEIVGMPTETVYGLAGNALSETAVRKIYATKNRPADNPLILHVSNFKMLELIAVNIPEIAYDLTQKFWPGALTIVLLKNDKIIPIVNGSLNTVAVRMPRHPVALKLIEQCGFPLAAPSANISGQPSPTSAAHVFNDLNGKIPVILDGGNCDCGVESTVIAFDYRHGQKTPGIRILRPGAITAEMLLAFDTNPEVLLDESVTKKIDNIDNNEKILSPGTRYKHYSPKARVVLVESGDYREFNKYCEENADKKTYALIYSDKEAGKTDYLIYGETPEEQARFLFAKLREADQLGAELIFARAPKKQELGLAVYNRLARASGFEIIELK